jgi:predicted alpha/beta-fold hydrolase
MMNDFLPPTLLRNVHVQSLLSSRRPLVRGRAKELLNHSVSQIISCGHGIRLQGYYSGHGDKNRDLAILIHGWEGSANSLYILSAATRLWENGFDIFRLNLRDHGDTHHLNRELFHSCRIDEVTAAVKQVQEIFRRDRVYLGGFSLGGNFALRVGLHAQDADISLAKIVAICPVLNPEKTLTALETGSVLYRSYFMKKWRRSLRKKREYFPEMFGQVKLSQLKTLTEMTDYFVRHYTNFPDMKTYLKGYSLIGDVLEPLNVPAHILASADDPVIPAEDLANLAKPEYLNVEIISCGGHCGFIDSYKFTSWADRKMIELFR